MNKHKPQETPAYCIIRTQSMYEDYIEVQPQFQPSMEALGLKPAAQGDTFLAKYNYTTTNAQAEWICVALPVPGPQTELLEFYCNVPYNQPLYFCQNRRQYFVWLYAEKADTVIQFGYVLLSHPEQYLLSNKHTQTLEESDAELALMRILRFETCTQNGNSEVTADSMRRFITTYQNQGLSLEHVIDIITRYFRNFKDETQEISDNTQNNDMALFTQRRGVCRHRAKLSYKIFKALLLQLGERVSSQYAFTLAGSDFHDFIIQTKRTPKEIVIPAPNSFQAPLAPIQDIWEDPFQESTPWAFDSFQNNNAIDIDITTICLGGGEGGQMIALDNDGIPPTEPVSSVAAIPILEPQGRIGLNNKPSEMDISTINNTFLIPYKHKAFTTKKEFSTWLSQYAQLRPMLLVIDNWETWPQTKRYIRHSMQEMRRLFASINNFDDIPLNKLPYMDTMPLRTFVDTTYTERPYSVLGQVLTDPNANRPIVWVDIRDYDPASLNKMFDHRREVKGKQIPPHAVRIAIIDAAQFREMGSDFLSRFQKIRFVELDFAQEEQKQSASRMDVDLQKAEFYFDDPQLSFGEFYGRFTFCGDEIHYIPGWLEQCLAKDIKHIILSNCPVGMSSFDTLLRNLEEGVLPTPFAEIPVHFNITCTNEKRLGSYKRMQLVFGKPPKIDFVLHTSSFPILVGTPTVLDNQNRFITQQPHLVSIAQDTLEILVLGKLSDEQWLRLDTYSSNFEKSLRLYFTTLEDIPSFWQVDIEVFSATVPSLAALCPANIDWVSYPKLANPQDFADSVPGIYIDQNETLDSLIGNIQKADTLSGFAFQESLLVQQLKRGQEVYLFGSPNTEVLSFFTSLLCSTPYVLVNGQIIPITQRIKLRFTHQSQYALFHGESAEPKDAVMQEASSSTQLCEPEQLFASIKQYPILHLRHARDIDGIALLMPHIRNLPCTLYRDYQDITTWLLQGGLFVINCLSEAPKDMLMLVRKFYYQQENTVFWQQRFYKTSVDTHRMLIADYKDSAVLQHELKGIASQYLDSDALLQEPEHCVAESYQKHSLSFYTQQLSVLMPVEQSLEMAQLLQNPGILHKDKLKRREFWNECRRILEAMTKNSPFVDTLTPSQIPMALLLMLHLQMKDALAADPDTARLARGLVLEGPPGIGKTRVIFDLLHILGYEDKLAVEDRAQVEKPGYVSAPTDDVAMCREALALAKKHGYILILDEINTLSFEDSYPDCKTVMNQIRDFLSNTETHSGILIASQNPSESFAGRNALNFLAYCFKAIVPAASKQDFAHLAQAYPHRNPKLPKQMKTACTLLLSDPKLQEKYHPPNVRSFLGYLENHNLAKRKNAQVDQADEESKTKKPKL